MNAPVVTNSLTVSSKAGYPDDWYSCTRFFAATTTALRPSIIFLFSSISFTSTMSFFPPLILRFNTECQASAMFVVNVSKVRCSLVYTRAHFFFIPFINASHSQTNCAALFALRLVARNTIFSSS